MTYPSAGLPRFGCPFRAALEARCSNGGYNRPMDFLILVFGLWFIALACQKGFWVGRWNLAHLPNCRSSLRSPLQ